MHTKGPWKADRVFIENAPDRMIVHVAKWGGPNIADCGTFAGDGDNIDNARLIAAAPELLEACKVALEHAQLLGSGQQSPYSNAEICEITGAAIAKAEGKE